MTQFEPDAPSKQDVLRSAVDLAGYAPSLYNAQPWSWQVRAEGADLFMDTVQSFPVTDPDMREMRIGCGAALHHLQVALAAAGWHCTLERSSGLDGGLLARVRLTERGDVDPDALRLVDAIPRRHTDRRPAVNATDNGGVDDIDPTWSPDGAPGSLSRATGTATTTSTRWPRTALTCGR